MTATEIPTVSVTIDDRTVEVPKGTLVIRAAEAIGVQIPRFCDHPLLEPVGACRQCLVEVEGQRKPLASCTTVATDGMVVKTQVTSEIADKAQHGVMELLLVNHPLDCPVCDKGGECPLQNQAMAHGRTETRFLDVKRTYPKPLPLSTEVLLDRERCVLCARCTRFSEQIAGDPFIELLERGALQQVGIYENEPFESYFSGNTVQICPVGALTSAAYRFRARPYDLVSTPSVCEHCASGCAQRTDHRRGTVLRRLAGDDPAVNEEWNCDKGRWAFAYTAEDDRITTPMIRRPDGHLESASWSEALAVVARELGTAGDTGVLTGGRLTLEDAYAYAKFARVVLHTNDIDFRSRSHSDEETRFLAAVVAGRTDVTYADLESASTVVLAGFEPEEESPIGYLRLRKAARTAGVSVVSVAPFATRGLARMAGSLLQCEPGQEADVLDALRGDPSLRAPGAIIVVGERLADSVGALSAAARLAETTGARIAWIPRRAGERGALDAGAFPTVLPGGSSVSDSDARRALASLWGVGDLPDLPGRDTSAVLAAARDGVLGALVVAGVEAADLPDPEFVLTAVRSARFVVSLEMRRSDITDLATVVLPVAPVVNKAGSYLDWEGRIRSFGVAVQSTGALPDHRVLGALAQEMGVDLALADPDAIRREWSRIDFSAAVRPPAPDVRALTAPQPAAGQAVLSTWRMLLDAGRLQDGEPHLAGTARPAVARLSAATAAEVGLGDGDRVTVSTERGALTLPVEITDLPDRVVWLPENAPGLSVHRHLAARTGEVVHLHRAGPGHTGEAPR